ncbi:hypothetical protein ACT3R7_12005 [Halomonas sp. AOP43-A1-21]
MRQNYVTFDFNNFDADGLASVKQQFEKAGLSVSDIEANNRSRRMSGFATKMARFYFQDGQSITLRIKGDGDVYQVQLNSRIIPIQQVDNMKGAVEEMARMAASNAPAWKKAQRKKQQRVKVNTEDLQARSLPRGKRIEALESEVAELRTTRAELESENATLAAAMEERRTTLQTLEQQVQAAAS